MLNRGHARFSVEFTKSKVDPNKHLVNLRDLVILTELYVDFTENPTSPLFSTALCKPNNVFFTVRVGSMKMTFTWEHLQARL